MRLQASQHGFGKNVAACPPPSVVERNDLRPSVIAPRRSTLAVVFGEARPIAAVMMIEPCQRAGNSAQTVARLMCESCSIEGFDAACHRETGEVGMRTNQILVSNLAAIDMHERSAIGAAPTAGHRAIGFGIFSDCRIHHRIDMGWSGRRALPGFFGSEAPNFGSGQLLLRRKRGRRHGGNYD